MYGVGRPLSNRISYLTDGCGHCGEYFEEGLRPFIAASSGPGLAPRGRTSVSDFSPESPHMKQAGTPIAGHSGCRLSRNEQMPRCLECVWSRNFTEGAHDHRHQCTSGEIQTQLAGTKGPSICRKTFASLIEYCTVSIVLVCQRLDSGSFLGAEFHVSPVGKCAGECMMTSRCPTLVGNWAMPCSI